jgi:sirohydrochlorin cobaltochelatase
LNAWILFAHGSSDPDWAQPMRRIAQSVSERLDGQPLALAFLERQPPSLEESAAELIRAGARVVTVIPMFLGIGGHLKKDLPVLIDAMRSRWATIEFRLTAPIGESDAVTRAIADFVEDLQSALKPCADQDAP